MGCAMYLEQSLKKLRLNEFIENYSTTAIVAEQQKQSMIEYLNTLVDLELETRTKNKLQRLLKKCGIRSYKSLAEFDCSEVPSLSPSRLYELGEGKFIENAENLLIFGATGTGKSHLCSGLAYKWCMLDKKVYYTTASQLVNDLGGIGQVAFKKYLYRQDIIIIDDLLWHDYTPLELNLLLGIITNCYEVKSLVLSAHLPFSQWAKILKDETLAITMVDKLIHHATILELDTESYRVKSAQKNLQKQFKKDEEKSENEKFEDHTMEISV